MVTSGVDDAGVVAIEHIEDFLDLEDIGFGESWPLVGLGVEFGLDWLLLFGCATHLDSIFQ